MLNEQGALREAQAADQALARGQTVGALHGVPMTIKDSLDTAGIISTGGTMGRAHFVPEQDATAVARLRAAGAIILGKTNTPELTLAHDTDNLVYGRTRNPYDLTRTPGGSSGGAAAIIAAGGSPLDIGSDTQGSIRVPSHFCGIAGMKPTFGRVPLTGHIIPTGGPIGALTQLGPLARYVEDLILMLPIICGPDGKDPAVVPVALEDPARVNIKSLRAAFFTENGLSKADPDVADTVRAAAKILADEGVRVEERQPEGFREAKEVNGIFNAGGGAGYYRNLLREYGTTQMYPNTAEMLQKWTYTVVSGRVYSETLVKWSALKQSMLKFMGDYDLLLCPPCSGVAPHPAELDTLDFSYAWFFNVLGWPAAVVRAGKSKDGLPIGVQVAGRPWKEHEVLAAAARIENRLGGWQRDFPETSLVTVNKN
jgi:amidase